MEFGRCLLFFHVEGLFAGDILWFSSSQFDKDMSQILIKILRFETEKQWKT